MSEFQVDQSEEEAKAASLLFVKSILLLPQFRPSLTRTSTQFNNIFKSASRTNSCKAFIERITAVKQALVQHLSGGSPIESKLDIINDYLQLIAKLLKSLNNQPPVNIDNPLMFNWRGSLTGEEGFSTYPEITYEYAMTLHTKAFLHISLASQLIDITPLADTALPPAAQHCLMASSIMEFLSNTLLPKWVSSASGPSSNRPPEVQPSICLALSLLFKGCAQQLSLGKALLKPGSTAPSLLQKLSSSAIDMLSRSLITLTSPSCPAPIHSDLTHSIRFSLAALSSFASLQQARCFAERKAGKEVEMGLAMACILKAQSHLAPPSPHRSWPLPPSPASQAALQGLLSFFTSLRSIYSLYERENNQIYFQDIPPPPYDLPALALPPGVTLLNPSPFTDPSLECEIVLFGEEPPAPLPSDPIPLESSSSFITPSSSPRSPPSPTSPSAPPLPPKPQTFYPSPQLPVSNPYQSAASMIYVTPQTQQNYPIHLNPFGPPPLTTQSQSSPRPRSDSDLARELQERLNRGESI